jgi:hypothetical protein
MNLLSCQFVYVFRKARDNQLRRNAEPFMLIERLLVITIVAALAILDIAQYFQGYFLNFLCKIRE